MMAEILFILLLITSGEKEFVNGIVCVVNTDIITYRDVKIFVGLKSQGGEMANGGDSFNRALNLLIEESIVFQNAQEQGLEPDVDVVNRCVEELGQQVKKIVSPLLEEAGFEQKDVEKRCLREETMKLFIENKFLKPSIIEKGIGDGEHLEQYKEIAINNYKIWLNDIMKKTKIEKFDEFLKEQEKR